MLCQSCGAGIGAGAAGGGAAGAAGAAGAGGGGVGGAGGAGVVLLLRGALLAQARSKTGGRSAVGCGLGIR